MLASFAAVFLICWSTPVGQAALQLTPKQLENITDFIEHVRICRNIPGLVLSVVSNESALLEKGFGFADLESGQRITPTTLFPIGSTTKAFTVTLLGIMLDKTKHRYTWDSTVKEILGDEFRLYNDLLTRETTLRDLLAHKTGIPGYFVGLLAGFPETLSRSDLIRMMRHHQPTHPLRTRFMYNNFMYMLAGHVAEVLGKDSWESLVKEKLFHPLNMTSTGVVRDMEKKQAPMALPYVYDSGEHFKLELETLHQVDIAAPAGAILSNARDMSKWIQFHLRLGKSKSGEQLLSDKLLQDTYHEQMADPLPINIRNLERPDFPVSDITVAYNMGWLTNYYRGYKRLWHSGGITAYRTRVWFYPAAGFGMFLSTNGPPDSANSWAQINILQYISDFLLGEEPWLNAKQACTFGNPREKSPSPPSTPPPDHPLSRPYSDYAGTYFHPGFGDLNVTYSQSKHRLELRMGRFLETELYYEKDTDQFVGKFIGTYWYMDENVPIKFKSYQDSGGIDIVEVPMYTLGEAVLPTVFSRGEARRYYQERVTDSNLCSCDSNDKKLSHRFLLLQLTLIAIMYIHLS